MAWSSGKFADSPSDSASSPAACGARFSRVRPPNDDGKGVECRIADFIDPQKCIETAKLPVVREGLGARDVVGCGARRRGDVEDPLGRHVKKTGLRVDEAPDQP